jgi:hypothetical protein
MALEAKKAAEEKITKLILGEIRIGEYERDEYDRDGDLDMGIIDNESSGGGERIVLKKSKIRGEVRGGSRTDERGHIMNTS